MNKEKSRVDYLPIAKPQPLDASHEEQDQTTAFSHQKAVILTDTFGQKSGSYLAAALLCRMLAELGLHVTCFAQSSSSGSESVPEKVRVVQPVIGCGWRWDWPGKCLAWQARNFINKHRPQFVFLCGVDRLARYLLRSSVANQLLIWENTNANPNNKFVDGQAVRLLGRARAVLSPSHAIDQAIRQTYGYQGELLRLPFWIEDLKLQYASPPTKFLADFIYLGRRDVEKGLAELVRATAQVTKRFPHVRVLIAGSGSEAPYLELALELGVEQNISFHFFESRIDTMNALKNSRCLVLPSYHEGYPLVLLEAAQFSVPIIATSVGSVPEVFGLSPAAILVPPKDVHSLTAAMCSILGESSQEYHDRRRDAHQCFTKLSSAESVHERLTKLLGQISQVN